MNDFAKLRKAEYAHAIEPRSEPLKPSFGFVCFGIGAVAFCLTMGALCAWLGCFQ
jgi:hypothetical protein